MKKNTRLKLPFKFEFNGEAWVVVQSPGLEQDPVKQCELCQYSRERPVDEGRAWCGPMASAAAHAANRWGGIVICGPRPVVYIRDTDEGWLEHARNMMAHT